MITAIAKRELRSLFLSPLAWAILGVLQGILTWVFLLSIDNFLGIQDSFINMPHVPVGVTDMVIVPLFSLIGVLLLLVMPLITMRLISEERRNKTLTLLLSSPVTVTDIVLGKFLAVLGFVAITLIFILIMSLSLSGGTKLDYGQITSSSIGLLLMMSTFIAIGLYISCLTNHPTVAAVITFGVLFMLWIINWAAGQAGESGSEIFVWLSLIQHQQPFHRGIISSSDALYYVIFTTTFLLLSIRRLDAERLQS